MNKQDKQNVIAWLDTYRNGKQQIELIKVSISNISKQIKDLQEQESCIGEVGAVQYTEHIKANKISKVVENQAAQLEGIKNEITRKLNEIVTHYTEVSKIEKTLLEFLESYYEGTNNLTRTQREVCHKKYIDNMNNYDIAESLEPPVTVPCLYNYLNQVYGIILGVLE